MQNLINPGIRLDEEHMGMWEAAGDEIRAAWSSRLHLYASRDHAQRELAWLVSKR